MMLIEPFSFCCDTFEKVAKILTGGLELFLVLNHMQVKYSAV